MQLRDTRFSSALCRLRSHSNVVQSTGRAAGHSVDAMGSHKRRGEVIAGQQRGKKPEIPEGSTLLDRREVIMIISEYAERFQSTTPSLHQTLAAIRGPDRGRQRSRRLWVAAALVGVMTLTCKVASHHPVHGATDNSSQVWTSGNR